MTPRLAYLRILAEILVAAFVGVVVAWKSSWCDPDAFVIPYWHIVLVATGFVFGFFGRSRIWLSALAASWVPLYSALGPMAWAFFFELSMFVWMFAAVFIGAVIGRWAKRVWIRRRARNAA
jgi:hypothetical protein